MNKIVALYARVSTGRQEKEETIASQIAEVKERVKKDGNVLDEKHQYVDDGWSGDLLARPALDLMRDAATRKEFEILYVWDRDRIARRYSWQELITDELQDIGIEVIDLHTAPIRNPEDKILLGFKGLFAEYEKIKIAERMRRGKLFKAKSGKIVHGDAPYGYTYIYKTKDIDCHFIVNEKEAETVRRIFTWIAEEGITLNKVIKRLYELGIPPRKGKREVWTNGPLSRLVRDEAYIGVAYYNKGYAVVPKKPVKHEKYKKYKKSSRALRPKNEWIPIPITPIIDRQLFDKVQKQLDINALYSRRNKKHDYLLSHKIWCYCGSRMFGEGSGDQYYYRCTDRLKNFPLPRNCKGGGLNVERVEQALWDRLKQIISNKQLVRKYASEWIADKSDSSSDRLKLEQERIQSALKKLDEQEARYVQAYGEGLLSLDVFRKNIDEVKKKRLAFSEQLNKHPALTDKVEQKIISIEKLEQKIPEVLSYLSEQGKQTIIKKIVNEIVIIQFFPRFR